MSGSRIYLDTESTGLMGPLNLVQVGDEDGNIFLIRPWKEAERMERLRSILEDEENTILGYNVKHDLWKLYQFFQPETPFKASFIDLMHKIRVDSILSPFFGKKIKSIAILKGIYAPVSKAVGDYVQKKIQSFVPEGIEITVSSHVKSKNFVNLSFHCDVNARLKTVIAILFPEERKFLQKIEETGWRFVEDEKMHLGDWEDSRKEEYLSAFQENEKILENKDHPFILYARKDVEYLQKLDRYFNFPSPSLNDSISEIVAWTRFHGFSLDIKNLKTYSEDLEKQITEMKNFYNLEGIDVASPAQRQNFLNKKYGLGLKSTGKKTMERLKKTLRETKTTGIFEQESLISDYSSQAEEILKDIEKIEKFNASTQRLNQAKKLLEAGAAFPDFREIGTASGRMSGSGGLNFQGIDRSKYGIRSFFELSMGGDFDSLELNLAAYLYHDLDMQRELKDTDMHLKTSLNLLNPPIEYKEALKIKEDKKHPRFYEVKEKRQIGKTINFSMLYFCSPRRIQDLLVDLPLLEAEKKAEEIYNSFFTRFPALKIFSEKMEKEFCSLRVDSWESAIEDVEKMRSEVENCFGFKRKFDFEKLLCLLFVSDSGIEKEAKKEAERLGIEKEKVTRSEMKGLQTVQNSVLSARLGAVLGIQRAVFRQAGNHVVQSSGAELTKKLMEKIWKKFRIPIMNIHDEILIPRGFENRYENVKKELENFLKENRKIIPTLSMSLERMGLWSEK